MSKKKVAVAAVFGGVIIFAVKLYSWAISGSVALLSDALESVINILASIMMFSSIWISERPPDENHKYGHQKMENISCLLEGSLIVFASVWIIRSVYGRLLTPVKLVDLNFAVYLSLFATTLNGVLSRVLMKTAKETGSLALEGDAKHLSSDVISSIGVSAGLLIGQIMDLPILDPIIALIVGIMILKIGAELIFKAGTGLMDESSKETEIQIRSVMDGHQHRFIDYHNLLTRKSGDQVFAELHLSVDGDMSVQEAHDFTDHLQADLEKEVPHVIITIHIEPPKNGG